MATPTINSTGSFFAAPVTVTLSNPNKAPHRNQHTIQIVPTGVPDGTVSIKARLEPTAPLVEVASVNLAISPHILTLTGHYHQLDFSITGAVGTTDVSAYIVSE